MGHQRLGRLPNTVRWLKVVERIAEGGSVAEVAAATIDAATDGLRIARKDSGLWKAVCLLVQVAAAAKESDFGSALLKRGIPAGDAPDVFGVACGLAAAMERELESGQARTDIGEMAQSAAVETLVALASERSSSLFKSGLPDVHRAFKSLATEKGFATLGHEFFARFSQKFLLYHLSRELSNHVGVNQRFADPSAHDQFVQDVAVHCQQACLIVRDFAGEWFSKRRFTTGIREQDAIGFAVHSIDKLHSEFERRRSEA